MLNECNGCEYKCSLSHIAICTLGSPCPHQRSTPMTNEEWLHTLNTEQLADAIYDLLIDRQWDSWSWKLNGMVMRDIHEHGNTKSTKAIMEWLRQPHTQKE